MNERLKFIRKSLHLNQEDFGNKLKLSRSHISSLENHAREITNRIITDICREFNINEYWLRTGEGEMFNEHTAASLDNQLLTWFNALNDSDKISLLDYAEFLVARQKRKAGILMYE